jgi:hypothetical protein
LFYSLAKLIELVLKVRIPVLLFRPLYPLSLSTRLSASGNLPAGFRQRFTWNKHWMGQQEKYFPKKEYFPKEFHSIIS